MRNSVQVLKRCIYISLFLLGASSISFAQNNLEGNPNKQDEIQTTITYCNLELPTKWKLANSSFSILYSFTLNGNGETTGIKKIRDTFVGLDTVKSCIEKWRLIGVPKGTRFSVYFVWKHGKGWVRQEIVGNGFTQIMVREKD